MFLGIIIAMIAGTLMSVQGVFNAEVTKQTSVWVSASFVQATALIVCLIAWLVTGRAGSFMSLTRVEPKYMLLGGAIGAFITYSVISAMQLLGPAEATLFIVTLQLVTAYMIEVLGMFGVERVGFEFRKIIGLIIVIAGIILFKWER